MAYPASLPGLDRKQFFGAGPDQMSEMGTIPDIPHAIATDRQTNRLCLSISKVTDAVWVSTERAAQFKHSS
jgi:hypothetical protein